MICINVNQVLTIDLVRFYLFKIKVPARYLLMITDFKISRTAYRPLGQP